MTVLLPGKIHSEYKPTGDQPQAIEYLSNGIKQGNNVIKTKIFTCFTRYFYAS